MLRFSLQNQPPLYMAIERNTTGELEACKDSIQIGMKYYTRYFGVGACTIGDSGGVKNVAKKPANIWIHSLHDQVRLVG